MVGKDEVGEIMEKMIPPNPYPDDPTAYYQPYLPLFGNDEGMEARQEEADRINATTNRWVSPRRVMAEFKELLEREGIEPTKEENNESK